VTEGIPGTAQGRKRAAAAAISEGLKEDEAWMEAVGQDTRAAAAAAVVGSSREVEEGWEVTALCLPTREKVSGAVAG
jgi:hypothetical protein